MAAPRRCRSGGAALLLAMLTVALVSTMATAALWQQWRAVEVEKAERQRAQAGWILVGALDWARLILREDERGNRLNGNADHLGEPWALPLEEARLSSFLAADRDNNADAVLPAFLSGRIIDQQSRLNFLSLVRPSDAGAQTDVQISKPDRAALARLYDVLNLPSAELDEAAQKLLQAQRRVSDGTPSSGAPLVPVRFAQLAWLGISENSLLALEPFVTVLPERTPVNLNTARAEVLVASLPGLGLADAQKLVLARDREPWRDLGDVARLQPALANQLQAERHALRSRFFEVRGQLRLETLVIEERSLVVRNDLQVSVLWRERFTTR
ncbi:MAG: type II secretion system minor pseudopilin GspK [Hydrogenophaga sp.]